MTDDELRRVYESVGPMSQHFNASIDELARHIAGLRAVFDAGRNDGTVYAEHSGQHDRREWHTVGTWLHPGDKIVVMYADREAAPLAGGKGEG